MYLRVRFKNHLGYALPQRDPSETRHWVLVSFRIDKDDNIGLDPHPRGTRFERSLVLYKVHYCKWNGSIAAEILLLGAGMSGPAQPFSSTRALRVDSYQTMSAAQSCLSHGF